MEYPNVSSLVRAGENAMIAVESCKARKTILMTVGHGLVSRNLLRSGFLETVKNRSDVRIVLLTTAAGNVHFEREFRSERLHIEQIRENAPRPFLNHIFNVLHACTVYTGTSDVKYELRKDQGFSIPLRKSTRKFLAFVLGRSFIVRRLIRWLDGVILPDRVNRNLLQKYKPDLVFCTSIIMGNEADLVKAAKVARIPVMGMVKSWDNLVKDVPLRVSPDILLVWNDIMKYQAIKYQLICEKKIKIVGIPQFDIYQQVKNACHVTREEYLKSIGADPQKKLILFAAEGKWSPADPQIVEIIASYIKEGLLKYPCHLHVRPHFCWPNFIEPLLELEDKGVITVEKEWNKTSAFPDGWDPSIRDMYNLAYAMKYADLVITSPSTIVLDASFFNKPVINIGFDGHSGVNSRHSVSLLYRTEYYKEVMKYDATDYVTSGKELLAAINTNLIEGGKRKNKNRQSLKKDFCAFEDGNSGRRIAEAAFTLLDDIRNLNKNSA